MKKLITILLSVPLLLSAGIVSETADTISYRQSNGETVTVHKLPKRPVVLHISLTGMWCGAGGQAFARPRVSGVLGIKDASMSASA